MTSQNCDSKTTKSATWNGFRPRYQCAAKTISKRALAAAKPGDVLRDSVVQGLHVRATSSGRKSFYLFYRAPDGTQRRPKIGGHPALTLGQARNAAREILAAVAAGRDPVVLNREARRSPTVAELCARYLQHIEEDPRARKKPRSVREDRRLISRHVLPAFGSRKVRSIEREDIEGLHGAMGGTPYQANRALALLSRLFTLAEKWRYRAPGANPCRHVDRYTERKRRRYVTRDEAPRIASALKRYEATHPRAVAFVYLLMLTGARPDEIARARWEWVERAGAGGVLRLPDSKVGPRAIYLSPHVMALLERTPRTSDTLTGIKSPKSLWRKIRAETGIEDLRLYDLRHHFASVALAAGYSLAQIGELLGHASTQTTARYAHLIEDKAHEAASNTAARVEQMLLAAS